MFHAIKQSMSDDALNEYKRAKARGRGSLENPVGRFEQRQRERTADDLAVQAEWDSYEEEDLSGQLRTQTFPDATRTIITMNDSPDVGMEATVNPYRGCEHGCIYCYARPGHEYLGLSAGLDFETKIFVKHEASKLLAKELQAKSWQPRTIFFSGVTDCYQPIERELKITRRCLQVCRDFGNPVAIVTKNQLVIRDIDILSDLASFDAAHVSLSVTSLDGHIARKMEPRASQPRLRLAAIEKLAKAGVSVGVMIGPVLPGLTDHEIPAILKAASEAGATTAHYTMLRLPYSVKEHFQIWLRENFPDRAERVLSHVRDTRGGKLYESAFGTRMTGEGVYADQVAAMMQLYKKRYGLNKRRGRPLSTERFNREAYNAQGSLF